MYLLTICLPCLLTVLIASKIWRIQRDTERIVFSRDSKRNRLTRAVRIVVESAILYTIGVICFFTTYITGNNAVYAMGDIVRVSSSFALLTSLSAHASD